VPLAATPLRHPQSLVSPKALDLLVIDDPTFTAGIVIRGPKPTTGMILGVLAQPGPQRGIRIFRSGRNGLVALGGAVLPGRSAS
jgi:hypothetical protein